MNKKITFPIIIAIILYLILCPDKATDVVKNTLLLWYSKVLPSLFPTLILVKMILLSNINIKRIHPFCFASGILCGFPIGATTSMSFVAKGLLSKEHGLIYATILNQFSPAFLAGYIALQCLNESPLYVFLILYGTQIALFAVSQLLTSRRTLHYIKQPSQKNETFPTEVSYKVVDASILSSCEALVKICGYMVLCSLLNSMIYQVVKKQLLYCILAPILEMTSGIHILCQSLLPDALRYGFTFAAVSFGGVSGILQVEPILSSAEIQVKYYILFKVISAITTGIVAYLFYLINH